MNTSARLQAIGSVRDGGNNGLVSLPHGELPVNDLFWRNIGIKGGPAHCRAYLPELLELVLARKINLGLVFDLDLPLAEIADADTEDEPADWHVQPYDNGHEH